MNQGMYMNIIAYLFMQTEEIYISSHSVKATAATLGTASCKERHNVKFFVCDMWQPYVDLAKIFLPNAKIVIDKYHFIRQVTWAIENVRKRLQKIYAF